MGLNPAFIQLMRAFSVPGHLINPLMQQNQFPSQTQYVSCALWFMTFHSSSAHSAPEIQAEKNEPTLRTKNEALSLNCILGIIT